MKHSLHQLLVAAMFFALSLLSGCSQSFFRECDWNRVYENASLPTEVETAPETLLKPTTVVGRPPATVLDPDRPARHLTLALAVAMALEKRHGRPRIGPRARRCQR